jgi:hypothetical protein
VAVVYPAPPAQAPLGAVNPEDTGWPWLPLVPYWPAQPIIGSFAAVELCSSTFSRVGVLAAVEALLVASMMSLLHHDQCSVGYDRYDPPVQVLPLRRRHIGPRVITHTPVVDSKQYDSFTSRKDTLATVGGQGQGQGRCAARRNKV